MEANASAALGEHLLSDVSTATPVRQHGIARALDLAVEFAAAALLVFALSVTLLQVAFRIAGAALAWPEELARFAFVWFIFLGAVAVANRIGHVAVDFVPRSLGPRGKRVHAYFSRCVSAASWTFLLIYGLDFLRMSTTVSSALNIPYVYAYLAIPVSAVINLILSCFRPVADSRNPVTGVLVTMAGIATVFGLQAAVLLPDIASIDAVSLLLICVTFLMLSGVPLVDGLVFGTFIAFLSGGELNLVPIVQGMGSAVSYPLLAIPFFMFAAGLMNAVGITERLLSLAYTFVGNFRGGLGYVNVVTNTLMGAVSGSATADAAAIAKTMVPQMERHGYPRPFGVALSASSAILATLIPPSLGLIIYASIAQVSVGAIFMAALVPGLLMAVTLAIVVFVETRRRNITQAGSPSSWKTRFSAIRRALPALVLPLVIVMGLRFGYFTATEAGAIACLFTLLCSPFIGRLNLQTTLTVLREALSESAAIMVILAASAPFAFALVIEQVPQNMAAAMGSIAENWMLFILVINIFLIFVGLAMEMIASMVILVPIMLPLLAIAGINPVHFGVIMVGNLAIGALTPPLAVLVFTAARVTNTPIHLAYRACVPFMIGLLIWLAIVTYIPSLSLVPAAMFDSIK